jgi:FG-GAP repeat
MRRTVVVMVASLAILLAAAWPASGQPERAPRAGTVEAQVDFNGDNFADLAVGAPGEGVGGATGAGSVNVLLGSAGGLEPTAQVVTQGSGGVAGAAEVDDSFGAAVAKGDFNGDTFFDLAVGAPGERIGSVPLAGAVNVLYGADTGLGGGPLFVQSNPESGDSFGTSLATADFNGDGFFDLAVGAPGENIGAVVDAGAVTVLFGGPGGITTAGSQTFWQGNGAAGTAEAGDDFGLSAATGLLAGDDLGDLVVGAPGEDVGAVQDAGAVNVLSGTAGGLANGSLATQGNPETGDLFGFAVTTGDFDEPAGDDVVAGAPGETVNGRSDAGAVSVFNGPPNGLASERLLFQGSSGIPGAAETGDGFGAAVAPTDTNGIGQWDLAIGVPGEDIGPDEDAGLVNLLAGSVTGPSGGIQVIQGNPEDFDGFGEAIAGGFFLHDFDGNGFFDLAVGAPLEKVGTLQGAGAINVFYASGGGGATVTSEEAFTQDSPGMGGTAEAFDFFGAALE